MRVSHRAALAYLLPLVLAAADPPGDVEACGRAAGQSSVVGDERVDIVAARARTTESGTAIRFSVTFARPLVVPDEEGTPFRVDVVLRDPDAPVLSFRYYRGVNRIIRYDAVPDALVQILLLPERGANVFAGATVTGTTLTLEVPGRLVRRDRDLEGLGLPRLRWSVISRDESDCDMLGDGSPTERVDRGLEPSATLPPDPADPADPETGTSSPAVGVGGGPSQSRWAPVLVAVLLGAACAGAVGIARRRRASGDSALRSRVHRGDESEEEAPGRRGGDVG